MFVLCRCCFWRVSRGYSLSSRRTAVDSLLLPVWWQKNSISRWELKVNKIDPIEPTFSIWWIHFISNSIEASKTTMRRNWSLQFSCHARFCSVLLGSVHMWFTSLSSLLTPPSSCFRCRVLHTQQSCVTELHLFSSSQNCPHFKDPLCFHVEEENLTKTLRLLL